MSGRAAVAAGLAPLGERSQGEEGEGEGCGAGRERGAQGTCCWAAGLQPGTKGEGKLLPESSAGSQGHGRCKLARPVLLLAMPKDLLQPGQPRRTETAGRADESPSAGIRLVQARRRRQGGIRAGGAGAGVLKAEAGRQRLRAAERGCFTSLARRQAKGGSLELGSGCTG